MCDVCVCVRVCAHVIFACVHVGAHACTHCGCVCVHVCVYVCTEEGPTCTPSPAASPQQGWSRNTPQLLGFQGLPSLRCPAPCPAAVTHQHPGLEDQPRSLPGTLFWHLPLPASGNSPAGGCAVCVRGQAEGGKSRAQGPEAPLQGQPAPRQRVLAAASSPWVSFCKMEAMQHHVG